MSYYDCNQVALWHCRRSGVRSGIYFTNIRSEFGESVVRCKYMSGPFAEKAPCCKRVEIEVFDVAHAIIGGGEEGDKTLVRTKEQADHSLPYMAAAILEDQVMPEPCLPERIQRSDVQHLRQKVVVRVSPACSQAFPNTMPCRVTFRLRGGLTLSKGKRDDEGFHTRP
jgi:2-methylcitrate dehydratase PrpD